MTPQIFELKQDGQVRYMQLIINRKLSARLHKCSVSGSGFSDFRSSKQKNKTK